MDANKDWQRQSGDQQIPQQQFQSNQQGFVPNTQTSIPTSLPQYTSWTMTNPTLTPSSFNHYYSPWFQQQPYFQQQPMLGSVTNLPQTTMITTPSVTTSFVQTPFTPTTSVMSPISHSPTTPNSFFSYPFNSPLQPSSFPQFAPSIHPNLIPQPSSVSQIRNYNSDPKRPRITYSPQQTAELENWYRKNKFISTTERNYIAEFLKVSPNQVRIWFQNRRARDRDHRRRVEHSPTLSLGSDSTQSPIFTNANDSTFNLSPINDSGIGINSPAIDSPLSTAFGLNRPNNFSMMNMLKQNVELANKADEETENKSQYDLQEALKKD